MMNERQQVLRYLEFGCNQVCDPIPTDVALETEVGDARRLVHQYFDALDTGDFDAAAECFSDDVVYSHPPYRHTGIDGDHRIEFHGRRQPREAFEQRGRTDFDHRILELAQRGPHCMFEGVVEGLPDERSGSFISSMTLDASGRIRRYVSFYCEPSIPYPNPHG